MQLLEIMEVKRLLIVLIALVCTPSSSHSQTFNLQSKYFQIGDTYIPNPPILFELAKKEVHEFSFSTLDSIGAFLIENDSLIIEVGVHTDQRYPDHMSYRLDQVRAEAVVDYLIRIGAHPEMLIAKGYGESKPIISQKEIDQLASKAEQDEAYMRNRRVEFIVVRTDFIGIQY